MGSFLTILRNNANPSLTDAQTSTNYLLNRKNNFVIKISTLFYFFKSDNN